MTKPKAPATPPKADTRLFVLEVGMPRPLDYALGQGTHELKDCGVILSLTGHDVAVSWLGHGPSAFLLPGPRQLQKGAWQHAEDRARVTWAGREWLFVAHELIGPGGVPPRGICLNGAGAGFPANALLLIEEGQDRGNFYRFRTEPFALRRGVTVSAARAKDGVERLVLRHAGGSLAAVRVDDAAVLPGGEGELHAEQVLTVTGAAAEPDLRARIVFASPHAS